MGSQKEFTRLGSSPSEGHMLLDESVKPQQRGALLNNESGNGFPSIDLDYVPQAVQ